VQVYTLMSNLHAQQYGAIECELCNDCSAVFDVIKAVNQFKCEGKCVRCIYPWYHNVVMPAI